MINTTDPTVSIIIPAFNEENTIAQILSQTESNLDALHISYEIIVVDDGSKDKTKHYASNNGATLISYSTNRGKGHAIRKGIAQARGQILVTMDADGSHRPNEIIKILKPLFHNTDVVIGSRFLTNQKVTSKLHIIGNQLFNTLILLLTRKKITDSQTGFRAFKRKVLSGICLFSKGYEIESELTIKTLRNGFTIKEEAITCDKRKNGKSKLKILSDGFMIIKTIIKSNFI